MTGLQTPVLVTGAGGFIGGRVVECLHARGYRVRAGLRVWSNAARISRFPVELVRADVLDPRQLSEAFEGIEAVVHCAVGGAPVTTDGTQNVLEAAAKASVKRFVHISTVDVYGNAGGDVTEEEPLQATGETYGGWKVEAEKRCQRSSEEGLPVCILRPAIVYGPFSDLWTVRPARRLASGQWTVPEGRGQGVCNLIYVDDLVQLIDLCLRKDEAVGQAFNAVGGERVLWQDYISGLRQGLGFSAASIVSPRQARLRAQLLAPVRVSARFALDRFGDAIMGVYSRYSMARGMMQYVERKLTTTSTGKELQLYERTAHYRTEKARSVLGYQPAFDMERGLDRSVAWIRHHGILDAG